MAPPSSTNDVFLYFLALFLPPLAVFFKTGCDANFLINIGLSILGWVSSRVFLVFHERADEEIGGSLVSFMRGGLLASSRHLLDGR